MRYVLPLFLLCVSASCAAETRTPLIQKLNTLVKSMSAHATVGVKIVSLNTGRTIYAYRSEVPMVPGSNMKVIVADAALVYLGPQYVFKTKLYHLHENAYLVFSGDPSFSIKRLNQLFVQLKASGVTSLGGNVYVDNTAYDQSIRPSGWNRDDYGFCFSAPITADIINHNCKLPSLPSIYISRKQNYSFPQAVDVSQYHAAVLRFLLKRNGIKLKGNIVEGPLDKGAKLIAVDRSVPLWRLTKKMLKDSDNVYAESIFKKVGQLYSKTPGSWSNGESSIKAILYKHDHVNVEDMHVVDGSGLSHNDKISAATLTTLLQNVTKHYASWKYFYSALPISSKDGTLKHRMRSIVGKVHAKTGSLKGVSSLSGYVETRRFGLVVFAIIVNDFKDSQSTYRLYEDKIIQAVALS